MSQVLDNIDPDVEATITEITIAPDGRVYVFGLSRGVLEMLASIQPENPKLTRLLQHVRQFDVTGE
jgi:hypothetical protein